MEVGGNEACFTGRWDKLKLSIPSQEEDGRWGAGYSVDAAVNAQSDV